MLLLNNYGILAKIFLANNFNLTGLGLYLGLAGLIVKKLANANFNGHDDHEFFKN